MSQSTNHIGSHHNPSTVVTVERRAYTFLEASEVLKVSPGFLRLEEGRGRLRVTRFGRTARILREDLESYIAAARADAR